MDARVATASSARRPAALRREARATFVPESPRRLSRRGCRERLLRTRGERSREDTPRARRPRRAAGLRRVRPELRRRSPVASGAPTSVRWSVPCATKGAKKFVDWQNDVTTTTSRWRERGLPIGRAPEALHDARHGHRSGQDVERRRSRDRRGRCSTCPSIRGHDDVPASVPPVALGAFRRQETGRHVEPTRCSAMHDWHVRARCVLRRCRTVEAAALVLPAAGRTARDATFREAARRAQRRRDRRCLQSRQDRRPGSRTSRNS